MNFKPTTWKVIISMISGVAINGLLFLCASLYIIQHLFMVCMETAGDVDTACVFDGTKFLLAGLIIIAVTYSIWSLFQKNYHNNS